MRIPDQWLDAIFFLGTDHTEHGEKTVKYRGTGFVLSAPNEFDPLLRTVYLVTARHNIEGARKAGSLWIRLNTPDGGSLPIEVDPRASWVFHDDPSIDIAISAPIVAGEVSEALYRSPIGAEGILTNHEVEVFGFGPGSDLITIGLFSNREGEARNIPVIRTGIVSAMPGEPISDATGYGPYTAFLAEILSIGGLSGSPVFYHATSGTEFPRVSYYLVGLIRSHWDELPPDAPADLPRREWMNRGIAAVTPATGILEVLGTSPMKEGRRRDAEEHQRQSGGVMDSGSNVQATNERRLPARDELAGPAAGSPASANPRLPSVAGSAAKSWTSGLLRAGHYDLTRRA